MGILKSKFSQIASFLFACVVFLSCQKDIDYVVTDTQAPDFITKVTSSVSGFVTDENNAPVLAASVMAGGSTTTTDKFGYFELKNIQVVKNAAVVTVTQPGYFKGIKTYIGENNKAAFFRIKLIPKVNAGSISATAGGNVTLSNGLIVALPANAVVNAANNSAYSGQVNVAAHWIDPVAADLNQTMPGDLRGIATDGSLKLLTTYGMAAVELTGASGELLQIASGKSATLTLTIPSSILAAAPATIPLWSFDEAKGLWKQEGQATKTGNKYIGEVSHFSFWNCDVPNNYVQFDCTLKDASGGPVPNAWVTIKDLTTGITTGGITDATGYVAGAVPNTAQLVLSVYTGWNCGTPVYTQNFSTTNINISLGDITVPASLNIATLSGTVTNCTNNPVTNGRIIVQSDNYYYSVYPVSSTGTFSFTRLLCSGNSPVNIIAEDLSASQQSTPLSLSLTAGANVLGNLQACGTSSQEFISYTINGGAAIDFFSPADSISQDGNGTNNMAFINGSQSVSNNYVNFAFNTTNIAVGTAQNLVSFYSSQIVAQPTITPAANITITEYGNIGEFIAGSFTATLVNTSPAATYTVVCNFRVRRSF